MSYSEIPQYYLSKLLLVAAAMSTVSMVEMRADEPKPANTEDEAAAKAQILDSEEWRSTLYDLDEWLSIQVIYDRPQVRKLQSQLQDNVEKMSKNELRVFLFELQDKLKILNSPEAAQARSWAQDYLLKASDSAAAEFRKKLPDVVSMTAAQIKQALAENQAQRAKYIAGRKGFEKMRDEQVAAAREMQRQAAEASARMSTSSVSNAHPGNWGGSLAPRQVTRYPGFGVGASGWGGGWRW